MTEQAKEPTVSNPVEVVVSRIEDHEFADRISELKAEGLREAETIVIKLAGGSWIFFDKDDVKAMASHFDISADDLSC